MTELEQIAADAKAALEFYQSRPNAVPAGTVDTIVDLYGVVARLCEIIEAQAKAGADNA